MSEPKIVHASAIWEMRIPVLATSHVKQDTFEKLEVGKQIADYEGGAFIFVPVPDLDGEEPATVFDEAIKNAYPEELLPVIKWFHENYTGQHWFRLDRDGDIVEGLPTYDW